MLTFFCLLKKTVNIRFLFNMHKINYMISEKISETLQAKTSIHNDFTSRVTFQPLSLITNETKSLEYYFIIRDYKHYVDEGV